MTTKLKLEKAPDQALTIAYARAIIPQHVRAIVKNLFAIPNLAAKKAARVRYNTSEGRTEPEEDGEGTGAGFCLLRGIRG